jgi:hypothetical protein
MMRTSPAWAATELKRTAAKAAPIDFILVIFSST